MPFVVACTGGYLRKGTTYGSKVTRKVTPDLDQATVFLRRGDATLACAVAKEHGIPAIAPKEVRIVLCCSASVPS